MKPFVSLLAFSAVGLSIVFADASQASNAETNLLAQMRSPRDMRDSDREPREPVDRSQIKRDMRDNDVEPPEVDRSQIKRDMRDNDVEPPEE